MGSSSSTLEINSTSAIQQWEQINQKDRENPIERIRKKLILAAKIDHDLTLFGASSHNYQLNPPLSLEKVIQLQEKAGCEFPKDYIDFITQIGHGGEGSYGGAGPYYGLYAFDEVIDRNGITNCALPCLLSPEMDIEEWKALCHVPENCSDEEFDIICDKVHQGTLYLGTCGCEYDLLLVINGPYKGHILYTSDWVDSHTPYIFSYETSFIQWYERWLDEVILGYDTSWFGHRMGGDENTLIQFAENCDDHTQKIKAISSLIKLPKLSNLGFQFLEEQLKTDNIELYKASLNVFTTYFKEQAIPYIKQSLITPFNEKTDIAISLINYNYKEQYTLFKESLLPILRETTNENTVRFIGYILKEMGCVFVEDFQPFFTHKNTKIASTAIYIASFDVNLRDKIENFFEFVISDNEEISLIAIQSLFKANKSNPELLPYLKQAWKMYPEEKSDYIRNNISSYITKFYKDNNVELEKW